jgi:hypothetical protein
MLTFSLTRSGDIDSDGEEGHQEGFQMPNEYDDLEVEFDDFGGGDQFDVDDDDAIDDLMLDELVPASADALPTLSAAQQYVDALVPDPNGVELAVVMASDPNDEYSYFGRCYSSSLPFLVFTAAVAVRMLIYIYISLYLLFTFD